MHIYGIDKTQMYVSVVTWNKHLKKNFVVFYEKVNECQFAI